MDGIVRVCIAFKRHWNHENSYKGRHLFVVAYSLRALVRYHHDRKHGGVQAEMVQKKEVRVLHLDIPATGGKLCHWA